MLHNITYQKQMSFSFFIFTLSLTAFGKNLWQGENYDRLSSSQKKTIQEFTADTLVQLPPVINRIIQDKVVFEFVNFDSNQGFSLPPCVDLQEIETHLIERVQRAFDHPEANDIPRNSNSGRGTIYGKTEKEFWRARYHIQLTKQFIQILLQGPDNSAQYSCGHHTAYRLAQATLLHEISHVYDDENAPATLDSSEKKKRAECSDLKTNSSDDQIPGWCRDLDSITHSISDRPIWKNILNWHAGLFDNKPRNVLSIRSPDAYEWTNLREAFAVNMEYFLLDSSFSCRRPEIFSYFRDHFHFQPAQPPSCKLNTLVYYSTKQNQLDLDWNRLYEIHFLLASSGSTVDSSYGHSMFRLVFCAPTRHEIGPDCLKDQAYHVVISFRANIEGLETDKIKGLLGKYPSQMFIYPLSQIISEYTVSQFRDLSSIPIKLKGSEKQRFVERILQYYWEYQGRYYFLTNNCATEAMNFIKGSIFRPGIQESWVFIETPLSLYRLLKRNRLLNEDVFDLPVIEGRYLFSSYGKVIKQTLQKLGRTIKNPKDIYELADNISAEQRRELFNSAAAKQESKTKIKDLAILFYRLERAISFIYDEDKQYQLNKTIAENRSSTYLTDIRDIVVARSRLSPWLLAESSYGIPLKSEMKTQSFVSDIYVNISNLSKSLNDSLTLDFPEIARETQKVNANLLYFFEQINKNVELPKSPDSLL